MFCFQVVGLRVSVTITDIVVSAEDFMIIDFTTQVHVIWCTVLKIQFSLISVANTRFHYILLSSLPYTPTIKINE